MFCSTAKDRSAGGRYLGDFEVTIHGGILPIVGALLRRKVQIPKITFSSYRQRLLSLPSDSRRLRGRRVALAPWPH